MTAQIKFTTDATKSLFDLFSAKTSRSDLKTLATAIADQTLTEDEFVTALTKNSNVAKGENPTDYAAKLFGYVMLSFGTDVTLDETVDFWQLLAKGETDGLALAPVELGALKNVLTLPFTKIAETREIIPWGKTEPVGKVTAYRTTIPFADQIPSNDDAESVSPVHYLKCVMTVNASQIGMDASEFYNLIAMADQYPKALQSAVSGQKVKTGDLAGVSLPAGAKCYYSDFAIVPGILHGQNVMAMTGNGNTSIKWNTRVTGTDGKVKDLNDFVGSYDSFHPVAHDEADTAGSWSISTKGNEITITYYCALNAVGASFGTGSSGAANKVADDLIKTSTTQLFQDIFENMGVVYVALKNELKAIPGQPTDFDAIVKILMSFYDKTESVEENMALMRAKVATLK